MLLADRLVVQAPPHPRRWPGPPPAAATVFGLASGLYVAIAATLLFRFHIVSAQALGLVANASYVLFSHDPHLAALGFVGSPLPSILTLPLLPLHTIWPALTDAGFAACIVSALFMGGAVYQLYQLLREAGVSRISRLGLTLVFAVHPLILYIAASGVAEAGYMFFLLLAARHVGRWLRDGDIVGLMVTGFALAGAYLSRYDALLAGFGVVVLVALVSLKRDRRLATAACDAIIVGLPLAVMAGVWAFAAWLVTGNPLPQLVSNYGYLAQLDAFRSHTLTPAFPPPAAPMRTLVQLIALEPGLLAAAVLIGIGWLTGRARAALAGAAILGPLALAVTAAGVTGFTFPWLRQLVVVVPLVTLLVGLGLAGRRSWILSGTAFLLLLVAVPTTIGAMLAARTGQEEMPVLRAIAGLPTTGATSSPAIAGTVARYLDSRHLAEASVLVDSFTGFPVILSSNQPRQFLITSDRDFGLALGNPQAFGIRYLLVPAPTGGNNLGSLDALNHAFPALWSSGSTTGGLEREFVGAGKRVEWRLYRVSAVTPAS
ncbi:MAG: hypothetical protein M3Z11_11960 [Candidatus Dormibacteraeota bacterium]|nr:hypothetical protein [Candidatus Dormibacteraeota bacterium]